MKTPSSSTASESSSTAASFIRSGLPCPATAFISLYLTTPFRLPVPGLWLDVFQKIKALGYSGTSFYVDWALVEGKPGDFSAEGVFALEPFFEAASEAGIYLLAVRLTLIQCLIMQELIVAASWTVHQRRIIRRWLPGLAAKDSWVA